MCWQTYISIWEQKLTSFCKPWNFRNWVPYHLSWHSVIITYNCMICDIEFSHVMAALVRTQSLYWPSPSTIILSLNNYCSPLPVPRLAVGLPAQTLWYRTSWSHPKVEPSFLPQGTLSISGTSESEGTSSSVVLLLLLFCLVFTVNIWKRSRLKVVYRVRFLLWLILFVYGSLQ